MGVYLQLNIENQVATVLLNRPELHNAFNDEMIQELHDIFLQLGQESRVRAIILAANGKSFCAGADLNWMQRMVDYSFDENVKDAMKLSQMLKAIHECPKPVIARVHGTAFGGGVGLVSACDMAVSLDSATFSLSEVKLGLLPAVISPFVMEKIGASAARRYFLTAERFTAQEAKRIGLLSETLATPQEVDQWIEGVVTALKANGPEAVSTCKTLIQEVLNNDWPRAMDITTQLIAQRRISTEGQEGMKAFLEKRTPAWQLAESAHAS